MNNWIEILKNINIPIQNRYDAFEYGLSVDRNNTTNIILDLLESRKDDLFCIELLEDIEIPTNRIDNIVNCISEIIEKHNWNTIGYTAIRSLFNKIDNKLYLKLLFKFVEYPYLKISRFIFLNIKNGKLKISNLNEHMNLVSETKCPYLYSILYYNNKCKFKELIKSVNDDNLLFAIKYNIERLKNVKFC